MVRALDVALVGGGLGGLAAALGLGRRGHRVRILERDPASAPAHVEDAFGSWPRRGVPHWELYHVFAARARLDREALRFACTRTARHDVRTRRALLRRSSLLDLPDALWSDEGVVAKARDELELHPYDPGRHTPGPSRLEMLSTIAAAS